MGKLYYAVCRDCHEVLELGKFRDWTEGIESEDMYTLEGMVDALNRLRSSYPPVRDVGWQYHALRLHIFLARHEWHRIAVIPDDLWYDMIGDEVQTEPCWTEIDYGMEIAKYEIAKRQNGEERAG